MKRNAIFGLVGLLIILVVASGCISSSSTPNENASGGPPEDKGYGKGVGEDVDVSTLPAENLSQDEMAAILYMREEEKLARDVYLTLYNETGLTVFRNIEKSEETHMDMVLSLIEKYNLTDPVEGLGIGEFASPEMESLYNELVERGKTSKLEALKVGAYIEELDIKDLNEWLEKVDNQDIRVVFENLRKGSENHLRAFVNNIEKNGEKYSPVILSEEEYSEIVGPN
ncbi:hypothetical protein A0127_08280 [Thermococcus peptonophilus]|uniref:DUF2202 domain-containing protein n=2 Tax=Thermococcus peptonophilus TaxID=53952 RepID=A0A142CWK6_9EURY|nr:DUF2202 domain-containing protein [Thermococcus peptonophilus]AMQ19158.1 hypothetical protein A0127_08280 [Thermococcus peptonophilus]